MSAEADAPVCLHYVHHWLGTEVLGTAILYVSTATVSHFQIPVFTDIVEVPVRGYKRTMGIGNNQLVTVAPHYRDARYGKGKTAYIQEIRTKKKYALKFPWFFTQSHISSACHAMLASYLKNNPDSYIKILSQRGREMRRNNGSVKLGTGIIRHGVAGCPWGNPVVLYASIPKTRHPPTPVK